jgi:hypothetical protein
VISEFSPLKLLTITYAQIFTVFELQESSEDA